MFTSLVDVQSGIGFIELEEDGEFTSHQFHVKVWGEQDFEERAPVAMHNTNKRAVPLTWILFDSHLMVDLIVNAKMLVNIRKVWGEDAIRVHCNGGVKIVDRSRDLPGYKTIWYKPTRIANIPLMLRATKKFQVVFDIKGGNFSGWLCQTGK